MVQDTMCILTEIIDGNVCIFDAKGLTIWHVMKAIGDPSTVKFFFKYIQEASPIKIKQNHFVNCSAILKKLMGFLKSFMKKELSDTLHFHTSGLETLHEFIDKEILPEEYGGTAGCLEDYFKQTLCSLYDHRDYLMNDDNFFVSTK